MAAASSGEITALSELPARLGTVRIASEYPNLAESLAAHLRLRRFSIYPLWGAAEAYPPENAELVVLPRRTEKELSSCGLVPLKQVLDFGGYLVANRDSLRSKDMAEVLASITDSLLPAEKQSFSVDTAKTPERAEPSSYKKVPDNVVWLALPDGHQQSHVRRILDSAGIGIDDYPSAGGNRRPTSGLDGVAIKVIRPQDMPLQVANGNFDLAITGRDWLTEHRYQFPSSPVVELLDLKYGWVRIVAVVSQDLPADNTDDLRQLSRQRSAPFRVASEYINIADHYARSNHLGMYRIIPTWGATEAFLPEDADLLIENTETGRTIARHNLKIIDTLFESTACLIGSTVSVSSPGKSDRIRSLFKILRTAVEAL